MNEATDVLKTVTQNANSDIVLVFVIFAVMVLGIVIYLGTIIASDRRERNKAKLETLKQDNQREEHLINVIQNNTEVMGELKVLLNTLGDTTRQAFIRIHGRLDQIKDTNDSIRDDIDEIKLAIKSNSKEE